MFQHTIPLGNRSSSPISPPIQLTTNNTNSHSVSSASNTSNMAVSSTVVPPPPGSAGSPHSTHSTHPSNGAPGPPPGPPNSTNGPGGRCCDSGRPIFTDPMTGQSVCSCQYDLLGYGRLAAAGIGIPAALSMYSAPYPEGMTPYFPALGADQAPFYSPGVSQVNFSVFFFIVTALCW